MKSSPRLSKSRYMYGLQCPLRLWYHVYEPELAEEADEVQQAVFDTGHEVGILAQQRYPGGVLVEADHTQTARALEQTAKLLKDPKVTAIYEAAFMHENVLVRVDILERAGKDSWNLIEVKSSTQVKEQFEEDVALQYWVLKGAGLKVESAGVMVLNRDYVYDGKKLNLKKLFALNDRTDLAKERQKEIATNVAGLHAMLAKKNAPDIEPGNQCDDPYPCPFFAHCTKGMKFPKHPVTDLPRLHPSAKGKLAAAGVAEIHEVPDDFKLNEMQRRVVSVVRSGKAWSSGKLGRLLKDLPGPVHYLDFETFMPAIPRYAGMRPYDQVPFQWSLHVEGNRGKLDHRMFLALDADDPREDLAVQLIESVEKEGAICTYSSFEARVIRQLSDDVPKLRKPLLALLDRLWDLLPAIRDHYYHPEFHGSFSIKSVLPALVPEMTYEGMDVAGGMEAGVAFMTMITTEDPKEKKRLEKALRDYCGQDTLAMVKLRERLMEN